jgi:hypothetical protein
VRQGALIALAGYFNPIISGCVEPEATVGLAWNIGACFTSRVDQQEGSEPIDPAARGRVLALLSQWQASGPRQLAQLAKALEIYMR